MAKCINIKELLSRTGKKILVVCGREIPKEGQLCKFCDNKLALGLYVRPLTKEA